MKKKNYQWGRAGFHFMWTFWFILSVQIMGVSGKDLDFMVFMMCTVIIGIDLLRVAAHHYAEWRGYEHAVFPMLWRGIEDSMMEKAPIREEERGRPTAITSYLLGIGVTYFLLVHYIEMPVMFAYMACIILSTGDPAARIIGISIGGPKITPWSNRTWAGSLGFFSASFMMLEMTSLLNLSFPIYSSEFRTGDLFVLQVVGCLAGAVIEAVVPRFDNFFIPLVSGIAMSVFYTFY